MPSVRVVVDSLEQHSGVVKALEKQGVEIEVTKLEAGDYEVNHMLAFERMTIDDLLKSIFEDMRLFDMIKDLANRCERPVLIIEGEDPFFSGRTINPASIQSFLKTIAVSFRVPAIFTLNEAETPEQKILERTLRTGRVTRRGHAYFKYTDKLGPQKLREYGIEILTSGNQVVVPPSIHREGQQYKWILPEGADLETFELPELPDAVIERFALLKSLEAKMRGCRTCFRWVINRSGNAMHGKEGRRLVARNRSRVESPQCDA